MLLMQDSMISGDRVFSIWDGVFFAKRAFGEKYPVPITLHTFQSFGNGALFFNLPPCCCRYEGTDENDQDQTPKYGYYRNPEGGFHIVHGLVESVGDCGSQSSGDGKGSGGI